MKIRLKKRLSKYKNRIFSFIAVVTCIPFLSINLYAVDYFDNAIFPDMIGVRMVAGSYSSDVNLPVEDFKWYEFDNDDVTADYIVFRFQNNTWDIVYNNDSYDYYLYAFVVGDGENLTFRPDSYISLNDADANVYRLEYNYTDYYKYDGSSKVYGFSALAKLPDDWQNSIRGVTFSSIGSGVISSNARYLVSVIHAPKDDDLYIQGVISAIDRQTDLIVNGNSGTSGIVSNNNSAIDNLDEVINEYRVAEESFFNDFNTNQQAITSDIVGWSWGGLVNCANWVGSTLTDYYNNMGDFRQYIIYPLMLGIALFFLGRGGSIIGHLFRKPTETTVHMRSVSRREGNTRYSTTTTNRQGGVWRR